MKTRTAFAEYRKSTGKNAKEVGDLIGVARCTIFRWESGETLIPVKHLAKVEAITGIPQTKLRPDLAAFLGRSR